MGQVCKNATIRIESDNEILLERVQMSPDIKFIEDFDAQQSNKKQSMITFQQRNNSSYHPVDTLQQGSSVFSIVTPDFSGLNGISGGTSKLIL